MTAVTTTAAVTAHSRMLVLGNGQGQVPVRFAFDDTSFTFEDSATGSSRVHVPLTHVLSVDMSGSTVDAHVLVRKGQCLDLVNVSGSFQGDNSEARSSARDWVRDIMTAAYLGVKKSRRLLVFINPRGGNGKAPSLFKDKMEPIFKAARCTYKAIYTEYVGHALKFASEFPLDDYDAVVSVSGDGTLHELINGFAQHKEPMRAFRIPIAPIPAGSGNAESLNLLGVEDGIDVTAATLNAIKGRPMAIDLLSVLQSGRRSFSFLSQCVGLMADLDLGTEHLRWMGSSRFVYGYLRGVIMNKPYQFSISVKTDMLERGEMLKALREYTSSAPHYDVPPVEEGDTTALPPLQYVDDQDGWTTFEGPILYMFAGKGPLVSRELMQFPVSMPNDGKIDLVIQPMLSRTNMLKGFEGAETGAIYWRDDTQYFKASAYRLRPLQESGNLSIDGERFPFEEYYAEVHRGLGTVLSMVGRYAVDFTLERPDSGSA